MCAMATKKSPKSRKTASAEGPLPVDPAFRTRFREAASHSPEVRARAERGRLVELASLSSGITEGLSWGVIGRAFSDAAQWEQDRAGYEREYRAALSILEQEPDLAVHAQLTRMTEWYSDALMKSMMRAMGVDRDQLAGARAAGLAGLGLPASLAARLDNQLGIARPPLLLADHPDPQEPPTRDR